MTLSVDFEMGKNELNLVFIIFLNLLNIFKFYSSFEVLELIIKFLVFYIHLHVVVNMIFVQFTYFICSAIISKTGPKDQKLTLFGADGYMYQ